MSTQDTTLPPPEQERDAFISWLCRTHPIAFAKHDAECLWRFGHVAALAWQARAAIAAQAQQPAAVKESLTPQQAQQAQGVPATIAPAVPENCKNRLFEPAVGCACVFDAGGGWPYQVEAAKTKLTLGAEYKVTKVEVRSSHTRIWVEGHDDWFNNMLFRVLAAAPQAEPQAPEPAQPKLWRDGETKSLNPHKCQLCRVGVHSAYALGRGQPCDCPAGTCRMWNGGLRPAVQAPAASAEPQPEREQLTDEQIANAVRPLYQSDQAARLGLADDIRTVRAVLGIGTKGGE